MGGTIINTTMVYFILFITFLDATPKPSRSSSFAYSNSESYAENPTPSDNTASSTPAGSQEEPTCGENERLNECPNACDNDACPTNSDSNNCIGPAVCLDPQCQCIENYKRDDSGACIPAQFCPPFNCSDPYEEYNACPPDCSEDCSQAIPTGRCPARFGRNGIILECTPKCRCIDGYWKRNGKCVPYADCKPTCGENERLNECPNACDNDACPTKSDSNDCIGPAVCLDPQCQCMENYKRDDSGACIPAQFCPRICQDNEEYSSCPQALCRTQNCTQIGQTITCPIIAEEFCKPGCVCVQGTFRNENGTCVSSDQCAFEPICKEYEQLNKCTSVCNTDDCPKNLNDINDRACIAICGPPKCECIQNYKRDDYGNCIPIENCPNICPVSETYSSCIQALCRPQNCSQIGASIPCSDVIEGFCLQGCVCNEGTYRNINGFCVPANQCDAAESCPVNEEYSTCTQGICRAQNCTQRGQSIPCPDIEPGFCKQGCVCVEGTLRNEHGTCVPIDQCEEQICPPNEELSQCIEITCRPQDCTQLGMPVACSGLTQGSCSTGCVCKLGTLRNKRGDCVPEDQCEQLQQCNAPNEVMSCERDCPPEKTCRNRGIKFSCLNDNKRCQLKCVCKKGYFRNSIGECISGSECDQCQGRNEYFSCGPECDNVCADLVTQNKTNCPIVNVKCNPKCYCDDDYARDNNNECVPVQNCPIEKCAANEEYVDCKRTCPPEQCFSLVARFKCPENPTCNPGCYCKSGYLRKKENSPCVPICDCPELQNSADCLRANEQNITSKHKNVKVFLYLLHQILVSEFNSI